MDRRSRMFALVLAIGPTAPSFAIDPTIGSTRLAAVLEAAPADVKALVMRARGCWHWAGEEPYDKERAAYINKALDELKCDELDATEMVLRRKYAGLPQAQEALDVRDGEVAP